MGCVTGMWIAVMRRVDVLMVSHSQRTIAQSATISTNVIMVTNVIRIMAFVSMLCLDIHVYAKMDMSQEKIRDLVKVGAIASTVILCNITTN